MAGSNHLAGEEAAALPVRNRSLKYHIELEQQETEGLLSYEGSL